MGRGCNRTGSPGCGGFVMSSEPGQDRRSGPPLRAEEVGDFGSRLRWWAVSLLPWACGAVGLGLLVVLIWCFAPGVPAERRPGSLYRRWHFERLYTAGLEAERRGEPEVARVAFLSALEYAPGASAPRIQLARMLAETGRFEEAAAQAALVGMDGTAFVHDVLLLGGRFDELMRQSIRLLTADRGREGVWLYSIRLAAVMLDRPTRAAIRAEAYPELDANPARESLDAVLAAADGRVEQLSEALARRTAGAAPGAAEILAGVDAWLDADQPEQALVWVNRHRGALGDFDNRLADFRIEQARGSVLAPGLLASFGGFALNESRWSRIAAGAAEGGLSEAEFERLAWLATKGGLADSRMVSVALWSLSVAYGYSAEAEDWEAAYRKAGGARPPVLLARALRDQDRAARARAALLLVKETPFPRELLHVVFKGALQ